MLNGEPSSLVADSVKVDELEVSMLLRISLMSLLDDEMAINFN